MTFLLPPLQFPLSNWSIPPWSQRKILSFLAFRVLPLEREIAELLDDLDHLTHVIGTDGASSLLNKVGDHPERLRLYAGFATQAT